MTESLIEKMDRLWDDIERVEREREAAQRPIVWVSREIRDKALRGEYPPEFLDNILSR